MHFPSTAVLPVAEVGETSTLYTLNSDLTVYISISHNIVLIHCVLFSDISATMFIIQSGFGSLRLSPMCRESSIMGTIATIASAGVS